MNFLFNIHNKVMNYCEDKSMCILCILWIVPFFAGLALLWTVILVSVFLFALFIPVFMPIFMLLSLGIALINIVMYLPFLSILFIAVLWFLKDQINDVWSALFLRKSYTLQKPVLVRSTSLILSLFVVHGVVYMLPIPNMFKFAILACISFILFKKVHIHCHKE